MYKILGGDGKEYGPVSVETLQQWINEGRANAQTQVQAEGSTEWIAMGQVPDFIPLFAAPSRSGIPPSATAGSSASGQPPKQMVAGPAVGLIVTAGVGALMQVVGMVINLFGVGMGIAGAGAQGHQEMPQWVNAMSGGLGIFFNIIGLIMSVVVLLGALKMKQLQNYNFAMTATIIAMVPCISPCCWIGLPIGIWALVILVKPEVKAAFQTT